MTNLFKEGIGTHRMEKSTYWKAYVCFLFYVHSGSRTGRRRSARRGRERESEREQSPARSLALVRGCCTVRASKPDTRAMAIINHQKILLQQVPNCVETKAIGLKSLKGQALDIGCNIHKVVLGRRREIRIVLEPDSELRIRLHRTTVGSSSRNIDAQIKCLRRCCF